MISTRVQFLIATFVAGSLLVSAIGTPGTPVRAQTDINPADFQTAITNPLYPISLLGPKLFKGTETNPDTGAVVTTRLESHVLDRTETLLGVTVTVLEEKAYVNDQLIETALDYFAQRSDGTVYYFGERVDNFENGKFKDHHGQWLSGENGNRPGIFMPARPVAGETFQNEFATGVAEDMATVISTNENVATPSGSYRGCLKTRDFTPLEPGISEFKFYCPGVGQVRGESADGASDLVSIAPAPALVSPTASAAPSSAAPARPDLVTAPRTGDGPGKEGNSLAVLAASAALAALVIAAGAVGVAYHVRRP